ncbi:MAG: AtpZ/AtpI family protein [Sphingobium sp.]
MAETEPGQEPLGEDARITSLQQRLDRAEQAEKVRAGKTERVADDGSQLGNRVLAELIGAPVGGAVIGWVLDLLFNTGHWLLLLFLCLGFIVGFRNIIRISTKRPDQ